MTSRISPYSFLGFLEAGITPAFTIITAQWYAKHEQGTCTGIWFSCNALSLTLGAIIAYGFAEADKWGDLVLPGWQVIFIFMGCLTSAVGVVLAIWLPDSPLSARFLSAEDRRIALERIRDNQESMGIQDFNMYQVKEAFLDPNVSTLSSFKLRCYGSNSVVRVDLAIFSLRRCAQHPECQYKPPSRNARLKIVSSGRFHQVRDANVDVDDCIRN